jgi:hypothetical protein
MFKPSGMKEVGNGGQYWNCDGVNEIGNKFQANGMIMMMLMGNECAMT